MTIETTAIITICVAAGIVGVVSAVAKHIGNDNKHPKKSDIVFHDVCIEKMKGQEDCFEAKLDTVVRDIAEIKVDVKALLKRH